MRGLDRVVRFRSLVVALVLTSTALASIRTGIANDPTKEEIIRLHQAWKESFANIRLVFERRNPGQWSKRTNELVPDVSLDEYYLQNEWIIADSNWYRHTMRQYVAGVLKEITMFGDDGECAYRVRYIGPDSLASGLPSVIDVEHSHLSEWPKGHINGPLEPLEHVWIGTSWSYRYDRKVPFAVERYEDFEGSRCAVIRQPESAPFSIWLDLDHDGLPRRIEPDTEGAGLQFHVDQFRKLPNGIWFPDHGTTNHGGGDPYYWKVTEVEINQPSPQSRFGLPPSGENTRLIDRTGKYSKIPHRKSTSHSKKKSIQGSANESTSSASNTNSPDSRAASETGEESWLWFLLGCATPLLPVLLIWKWVRPR